MLREIVLKLSQKAVIGGPIRRLSRRVAWTIASGEAAGMRMHFPQNLEFILGTTERPVQECLSKRLREGDVFYDVGANVGFFSLLASRRVGASGAVYALEPVASNAAAIRANALLNGVRNLRVFELAAGEASGVGELFVTTWDGGSSLVRSAIPSEEPVEARQVAVTPIDDLITALQLRPPTLVKVDVEGLELQVLRGMQRTLASHRPDILCEVDDSTQEGLEKRWRAVDAFLAGLGYEVSRLASAYPNRHWFVGHSFATRCTDRGHSVKR